MIAADKPAVISKTSLDAIVVENGQSDGRFSNPPCTDEGDWSEVFCETNDLFDQLVASEAGSWWRGRRLSEYTICECKVMDSSMVEAADPV